MIERARLPEDEQQALAGLERKEALLRTINEFALKLLTIPNKNELVWYVAREVVGRLGFSDCVIYLAGPERKLLRQAAAIGAKNPQGEQIVNALETPFGQGITGHVAQSKQPLIVDDLSKDSRYIEDVEQALSQICVPLLIDGEAVGVIDSEDPQPGHFGQAHLEILTTIAAMTSAKLQTIEEAERSRERTEALRRLNQALAAENQERQRAELALQEREAQFKLALQISRLGSWSSNPDNSVSRISPEMADLLGVPLEDVDGISNADYCARFVHPEDRDRYDELMELSSHEPWRFDIAYGIRRGDGSLRWVREIGESLLNEKDEVVREVGTIQDITEVRNREETIRTREAWLRAIFENSPQQIVLKDTEGRIMIISRNVVEHFGITAEEAVGRKTSDFLPAEIAEIYMAADRNVVETGLPIQQEVTEDRDGARTHFLNAKFPLFDSGGQIIGVCSMTTDITEQKRAEARLAQAQKMEAVGQLTGGVAHDFNNLLAIILGNAELLEGQLDGEAAELLESIARAGTRGAELTQRLLAFSRRQSLQPRTLDLRATLGGLFALIDRTLGEAIEVEYKFAPQLWAVVADPGQVENAVLNLAINSRDAMPGGGRLTVEAQNATLDEAYTANNPEAKAGDYVVVAVSDNGTGMSPEVLRHAAEPFFTTKGAGRGSGLGLSMVYGFIKQSGGHISIYSEEGLGTTVKLYLPRADAGEEVEQESKSESISRGRGELVLVVEDDKDVRILAIKLLDSLGYRIIDAADAETAISVFEAGRKIDLVLSDVILPGGVNGPAFVQAARKHQPGLKVVFVSGYPAEAATRNGLLDPETVLLGKPFQRRELATALRRALDG
jgi:PAS domain S-box-containing protein